jgi:hypothetical protein
LPAARLEQIAQVGGAQAPTIAWQILQLEVFEQDDVEVMHKHLDGY